MKKICFLIASLAGGGAERLVYILNKRLNIYNIITIRSDLPVAYDIPEHKIISLDIYNKSTGSNLYRKVYKLIKAVKNLRNLRKKLECDIVVSHFEPANLLNVLSKTKEKTILVIHEDYTKSVEYQFSPYARYFYKYMGFRLFNKADLVVTVSKQAKTNFCKVFKFPEEKVKVIYNPINIEEISKMAEEDLYEYEELLTYPNIINIGRLTKQKGQWYLIRIFRKVKEYMPELKLLILGEGELKDYLVELSKQLGLRTFVQEKDVFSTAYDVYFLGFQKNPFKFLAKSDLFVFTSLWEGFGYALLEAMACGVPVISADCESGPREILSASDSFLDKKTNEPEFADYGILMPVFDFKLKSFTEPLDEIEDKWVDIIKNVLVNEELKRNYSIKGLERAKYFDIENVIKEWQKVLF